MNLNDVLSDFNKNTIHNLLPSGFTIMNRNFVIYDKNDIKIKVFFKSINPCYINSLEEIIVIDNNDETHEMLLGELNGFVNDIIKLKVKNEVIPVPGYFAHHCGEDKYSYREFIINKVNSRWFLKFSEDKSIEVKIVDDVNRELNNFFDCIINQYFPKGYGQITKTNIVGDYRINNYTEVSIIGFDTVIINGRIINVKDLLLEFHILIYMPDEEIVRVSERLFQAPELELKFKANWSGKLWGIYYKGEYIETIDAFNLKNEYYQYKLFSLAPIGFRKTDNISYECNNIVLRCMPNGNLIIRKNNKTIWSGRDNEEFKKELDTVLNTPSASEEVELKPLDRDSLSRGYLGYLKLNHVNNYAKIMNSAIIKITSLNDVGFTPIEIANFDKNTKVKLKIEPLSFINIEKMVTLINCEVNNNKLVKIIKLGEVNNYLDLLKDF